MADSIKPYYDPLLDKIRSIDQDSEGTATFDPFLNEIRMKDKGDGVVFDGLLGKVRRGALLNLLPVIPDGTPTSVLNVTDTAFDVISSVSTNSSTVVELEYGTVSGVYTDTVTADESPVNATGDVNFTMTGLTPFTNYYFRVKAENSAGIAYSQEFVQQTAEQWYGIEFDETAQASAVTRIASSPAAMSLHASLPIQSLIRGCVANSAGVVQYYLHPDNSALKADGTPANLTGADGQVVNEYPEYYYKYEKEGNIVRKKYSLYPLPGFTYVPKLLYGKFKGTIKRSTNQLMSVINTSTDFRGGNNNAAWDAQPNTLLGKPATAISETNFRLYARNYGARWAANSFFVRQKIVNLYELEYANRNVQLAYNAELTAEGYKQGGLGAGVIAVNSTNWNTFNGYYPLIPCGVGIGLGNKSGAVNYTIAGFPGGDITVSVPVYRGVESLYGDIWEWEDGILYNIQSNDSGGQSQVFICDDPANYADTLTNYRQVGLLPRAEGYITKCLLNEGLTIPTEATGGSSTTRYADYFYTSIPASGSAIRGSLVSASANYGALAGLFCLLTSHAPSLAFAYFGSRPCFIP